MEFVEESLWSSPKHHLINRCLVTVTELPLISRHGLAWQIPRYPERESQCIVSWFTFQERNRAIDVS